MNITMVEGNSTIYIRADGSIDPPTANIMSVDNTTYIFTNNIDDAIVVERDNITIDGNGYTLQGLDSGTGLDLTRRTDVTIRNTEIKRFFHGISIINSSNHNTISNNVITVNQLDGTAILLNDSSHNIISENEIIDNYIGIELARSSSNLISENNITHNIVNISFSYSKNNTIVNNIVTGSHSFGIGIHLDSANNIISNNNITGNRDGVGIYIIKSQNTTISSNNIIENREGIVIDLYRTDSSNHNTISKNILTNNRFHGIHLISSSNNTISGNTIADNNGTGIFLENSSKNILYHNNFVHNTIQVDSRNSTNTWNNSYPSGGNYWDDYVGTDSGNDGIGDTPYSINSHNRDNYPLMGSFSSFNTSLGKFMNIISNSTIERFEYELNSTIRLYMSNFTSKQSVGFCRVSISEDILLPPYTVIINDGTIDILYFQEILEDNGTYRWIYFAYPRTTQKIDIIPEYTVTFILTLFILVTLITAKINKETATIERTYLNFHQKNDMIETINNKPIELYKKNTSHH